MSGLIVKLAPGERIWINGALIENGDRRAAIRIVTPGARLFRERLALPEQPPNGAEPGPAWRACLAAQQVLKMQMPASQAASIVQNGLGPDPEEACAIREYAATGDWFAAFKALRAEALREAA